LKNIVNHDVWLKIKLDVELLDGLNFRNENAKTNIAPLMIRNCSIKLKLCGGTSLALLDLALGGRFWGRLRFLDRQLFTKCRQKKHTHYHTHGF
jgi:hypothetical protein